MKKCGLDTKFLELKANQSKKHGNVWVSQKELNISTILEWFAEEEGINEIVKLSNLRNLNTRDHAKVKSEFFFLHSLQFAEAKSLTLAISLPTYPPGAYKYVLESLSYSSKLLLKLYLFFVAIYFVK